jgi:hypothetical protein
MKSRSYDGTAYRQGTSEDASWIVSFVAPAEEILEWAGIPQRTSDNEMAGFQRTYDPGRVDQAKAFFDIPLNQSPTAIVIGFHPNMDVTKQQVELAFLSTEGSIRPCKLVIRYPESMDDNETLSLIRGQIERRISESGDSEGPEVESPEDPDESAEDEEAPQGGVRALELGRSLLVKLVKRLDDAPWRASNKDALLDLAKPATVIDGQHRLKGAERCERGIPFAVCGLFECPWAEQVFQFTVINYTQEGIQDQFITSNAALSLTQPELNELQDRLVQAGVNVVEYQLMKVVHFHDESPFKDLVNLTDKKNPSLIGYKTMVRLAKAWYDGRHQVFRLLLPSLYPDIAKKTDHKLRVARWQKEEWGAFFLDFWKLAHKAYYQHASHQQGHTLWQVGHSNLIVAIVLFELQSAFFNSLAQQDEEFFVARVTDPAGILTEMREKVQRRAGKFLEWFPTEFFGMRWGYSSLSIGPGRKALQDCFEKMVLQKGTFRYANSGLVTGQT